MLGFQSRQLPVDPTALLFGECHRVALRSPTGNRNANRAVCADANDVPARARMADELGGTDARVRRGQGVLDVHGVLEVHNVLGCDAF